jgi:hypothetical protein
MAARPDVRRAPYEIGPTKPGPDCFYSLQLTRRGHAPQLPEATHVDQRATDPAIAEMIDLGFCDAVSVDAGIARDYKGAIPNRASYSLRKGSQVPRKALRDRRQ